MNSVDIGRLVLVLVVAALVLRWNLWRAVLCLRPEAMRVEADAPADQAKPPTALASREAELLALGFVRLGSHTERPPLGAAQLSFDYVHPAERTFATLYGNARGQPRLYFFTPTANGGFVITADHRRPAREEPGRYLSGAMDDVNSDRVFKAHLRRLPEVGPPADALTHDARLAAGRAWYQGAGRHEVRQQNALGLLWTLGSLGMVGAMLVKVSS